VFCSVFSSLIIYTQFERLCKVIHDEFGPDVYPLVLQFNSDGMPVDGLGKRSLKPYKIRIKNVSEQLQNSTTNLFTVAYGPVHHYTKPVLMRMLEERVPSKSMRDTVAIPYLRRYMSVVVMYLLMFAYVSPNLHMFPYVSLCLCILGLLGEATKTFFLLYSISSLTLLKNQLF
jgi:hypothetical protein